MKPLLKVDLATTVSITTTYVGEFAGRYIAAALLSGNTLASNAITVKPNIKYKEIVKKFVGSGTLIADATCDFTATGTLTLTERVLTPEEFQVNAQLCKKDFRSDWEAAAMGYSVFDKLPPSFSEFIMAYFLAATGAKIETNIWHGVNATAGQFDGFVVLMTADAEVIDVADTSTIDSSNVFDELGKLVDAVPAEVYSQPDFTIYVAPNVARAYIRALSKSGFRQEFYVGDKPLDYEGKKLFVANGLSSSYMVAAQASNLWFGTGLLSDQNEVKVLDMADLDGSQNVRFVMRFTAGVQYGLGSEIVLYTPPAAI